MRPWAEMHLAESDPYVGGCDLWVRHEQRAYMEVWIGWHSHRDIGFWNHTRSYEWKLIGYQIWLGRFHLRGKCVYANPSMTPKGINLTPRGHYKYECMMDGTMTSYEWQDGIL